jgi:hypothetical protein
MGALSPRAPIPTALATMLVALVAGSGSAGGDRGTALPKGAEAVSLDPRTFTAEIDNPYLPLAPGSKWVYREVENGRTQKVVVKVTDRTRRVDGIRSRVVHDVVSVRGNPVEDTFDWYSQDSAGNVWYMGEDTKEYEHGNVASTAGSWEAGVDGAQAGIAMPADPRVGMSYRQEYYAGEAEDRGRILSVEARASVPYGTFTHGVMTEDSTPLEPLVEHKVYARGIGPVETTAVAGGGGREVLVSFSR